MQRPDLATLACVNADCQHYGRPGPGHLTIRKVYGQDGIRLLRCQSCHEGNTAKTTLCMKKGVIMG